MRSSTAASDKVHETRGRVLGGGTSLLTRELGLAISKNDASIRISTLIGKAINQRFFTLDAGVKKGVANPERDNYLALAVAPRYKHNLARYLRVIRNIAAPRKPGRARSSGCSCWRRSCWSRRRRALASLQLEAIGNEAIGTLKQGLQSSDPEVRFYAAEALAYLDQPEAAAPLAEAAKNESAFRWHALTALADDDARRGARRPERLVARAERRDALRRVPGHADPQSGRSGDQGRGARQEIPLPRHAHDRRAAGPRHAARACRRSSSSATSSG